MAGAWGWGWRADGGHRPTSGRFSRHDRSAPGEGNLTRKQDDSTHAALHASLQAAVGQWLSKARKIPRSRSPLDSMAIPTTHTRTST